MQVRPVLFILGILLATLGLAMAVPLAVDFARGQPNWSSFAYSAMACEMVGGILIVSTMFDPLKLSLRQGFLLTTLSWFTLSAFGALPFFLGEPGVSYTDAFFEASSGLTTTGSTVLVHLDNLSAGILMWRALLQWMGGIGIIVMAIAMLPYLSVGGMQLFRMESSDQSEKILPRAAQLATATVVAYLVLSVLCAASYWLAGMTTFDAIIHSMTTISTGGYSTYDASLGHFSNTSIQWIATFFMTAGALPFVVYIRAIRERPSVFWKDSQVRHFLSGLAAVIVVLAFWLWAARGVGVWDCLRLAAFNVVSIVTTTGFASADYSQWGAFATIIFFFLTFVGGCTGSTSGGIKILRLELAGIAIGNQLHRQLIPHGVFPVKYMGRSLPEEVTESVMNFLFVFIGVFVALVSGLSVLGLDFLTAASGAATAIANVGPGLGDIIGPAGNFAALPDAAKWMLTAGMLMGRLEFLTVLVIFTRFFWRG